MDEIPNEKEWRFGSGFLLFNHVPRAASGVADTFSPLSLLDQILLHKYRMGISFAL